MSDANTTADDLINELVEAAREFARADATMFEAEAPDEFAAYREGSCEM